ncbi:hypothetical protein EJV44_19120 [Ancylobacter aquaticus]|nr:hypothetical protein EJV44_19120 [Ancylobacter aquaticus]
MDERNLKELKRKGLTVLRLKDDAWDAIVQTRRRGQRFSLNFPHQAARQGQRDSLVLVTTPDVLRMGVITSISATSTLESRLVFDLLTPISPNSLSDLLAAVDRPGLRVPRDRLVRGGPDFERVSEKLGEALIDGIAAAPENGPAIARVLAHRRRPARFEDARALQRDAVSLAIKAFGGSDEASAITLPGADSAIGAVRLLEDAVIEHDARWLPGWRLADSTVTGRVTFEKRGERLDVFTANKRPLEQLFGVDLIYLNEARGALVMVQYKMLEPEERGRRRVETEMFSYDEIDEQEWTVRIDTQFDDELKRMRQFDRDLDPTGPYRLNAGAFFFKFVRRHAAARTAGILMSLGHLDQMLQEGNLSGPRGGLRLSYSSLGGHYLRSEPFVELIRSGYVGTRGATTTHLQALIEASLDGGKAVVAAVQTALAGTP